MKAKLTDDLIKRTKPDRDHPRRIPIFDTVARGLALVVQPTGRKSFYFVVSIGKRQRWIKLPDYQPELRGSDPETGLALPGTLDHARAEVARLRADVLAGKNPANERIEARAQVAVRVSTFGELREAWLLAARTGHGRVSVSGRPLDPRRTWQQDEARLKLDFSDWTGKRLDSLTPPVVAARIAKIAERSPTTANRCTSLLAAIFHHGVALGAIASNPAARIRRTKEPHRERYLDESESARLLCAIQDEPDPRWAAFFCISLLCGTRRGELTQLRWSDVRDLDGDTPTINLRASTTKTQMGRSLPLPTLVVKLLRVLAAHPVHRRRTSPFVFPSPASVTGHIVDPHDAWRRQLERAGIAPDVTLHDCRRGLATGLAEAGTARVVAQHVLGHSGPAMTERVYLGVPSPTIRAAIDAHAARLEAAAAAHASKVVKLRLAAK